MRHTFLFFASFFFYQGYAQTVSFQKDDSFYPPTTRAKMRLISDSLHKNYQFNPVKQFWSQPQAFGHWVKLDTLVQEAKEFLKTQPNFEAFVKKYPFAEVDKNQVIMRQQKNWGSGEEIEFYVLPQSVVGYDVKIPFDSTIYNGLLGKKWVVEILKAHIYRPKNELEAFFIEKPFEKRLIPSQYAQQIQYVDMLVDTNTNLYLLKDKKYNSLPDTLLLPHRKALYKLIFPKLHSMFYIEKDLFLRYRYHEDSSYIFIEKISKTKEFINLLVKASDEALVKQIPSATLEALTLRYLSPKKSLRLKRIRRVNTNCGNDNDPRYHNLSMAQIAGDVGDWQVFIKAHTELLSYPFDGVNNRKILASYTDELDSININVPNFLIGSFMKIDDPSYEHFSLDGFSVFYNSSIYFKQYGLIEKMLCNAIQDKALDDYNRFFCYKLFNSFISHQLNEKSIDKNKKAFLEKQREKVRLTLPSYLASKVKNLEAY